MNLVWPEELIEAGPEWPPFPWAPPSLPSRLEPWPEGTAALVGWVLFPFDLLLEGLGAGDVKSPFGLTGPPSTGGEGLPRCVGSGRSRCAWSGDWPG